MSEKQRKLSLWISNDCAEQLQDNLQQTHPHITEEPRIATLQRLPPLDPPSAQYFLCVPEGKWLHHTVAQQNTDKAKDKRGSLKEELLWACSWALSGHLAGTPGLQCLSSTSQGPESQMLRAAKVFTKVTCVFTSASLLLTSLWLLLLSRALWRCLSSCRFFFSSRCCSLRCLFETWKRQ